MIYTIFLDGNKIGTSLLEKADPPMGVVFGKIQSDNNLLTYDVINDYCKDKGVTVTKYPEDKLILTQTIPTLKVFNENKIDSHLNHGVKIFKNYSKNIFMPNKKNLKIKSN